MEPGSLPELIGMYFLTPHENNLMDEIVEEDYVHRPHTPIAVQDGWDVSIVDYIRKKIVSDEDNKSSSPLNITGTYFLSPQEHSFVGSTLEDKYDDKPHTPLAVQDGWDVSVVDYIRQKTKLFHSVMVNWLTDDDQDKIFVETLLSPLKDNGETRWDPKTDANGLRLNSDLLEKLNVRNNEVPRNNILYLKHQVYSALRQAV